MILFSVPLLRLTQYSSSPAKNMTLVQSMPATLPEAENGCRSSRPAPTMSLPVMKYRVRSVGEPDIVYVVHPAVVVETCRSSAASLSRTESGR